MTHLEWLIAANALRTPYTLDSPALPPMTGDEYLAYLSASGERFAHLREPDHKFTATGADVRDTEDYNAPTRAERFTDFRAGQNQHF